MDTISKVKKEKKHKVVKVYTETDLYRDLYRAHKQGSIKDIIGKHKLKKVYGIPRGGLILAVYLSHLYNLKLITRKDQITNNTLVVDDIVDSGRTMENLTKYLCERKIKAKMVVIHINRRIVVKRRPTLYFDTKSDNEWIKYFWELK